MADIFNITQCNLAQLIAESNRFLFQVLLVHITTSIIEGKDEIFGETLFKALLITAIAILMYHLFFRKIVEPKLEKMKMVCNKDAQRRLSRVKKIHTKDPLRPKYRTRLDRSIDKHRKHDDESKQDRMRGRSGSGRNEGRSGSERNEGRNGRRSRERDRSEQRNLR